MTKKQQERSNTLIAIIFSKSSKYSKKKTKINSRRHWVGQYKQVRGGIICALVQRSVKNGKRTLACHSKFVTVILGSSICGKTRRYIT